MWFYGFGIKDNTNFGNKVTILSKIIKKKFFLQLFETLANRKKSIFFASEGEA